MLAGNGLPSFSVHSCIARWRPIAAREVVAAAAAAGVAAVGAVGTVGAVGVVGVVGAVVGDIAGIADKPDEVAGTWWWCLPRCLSGASLRP